VKKTNFPHDHFSGCSRRKSQPKLFCQASKERSKEISPYRAPEIDKKKNEIFFSSEVRQSDEKNFLHNISTRSSGKTSRSTLSATFSGVRKKKKKENPRHPKKPQNEFQASRVPLPGRRETRQRPIFPFTR